MTSLPTHAMLFAQLVSVQGIPANSGACGSKPKVTVKSGHTMKEAFASFLLQWSTLGAEAGRVVAGGQGWGDRLDQLNRPSGVAAVLFGWV